MTRLAFLLLLATACDDTGLVLSTDLGDASDQGAVDGPKGSGNPNGVRCGPQHCLVGEWCCPTSTNTGVACQSPSHPDCASTAFRCDGPEECGPDEVCQGSGYGSVGSSPSDTRCVNKTLADPKAVACHTGRDCETVGGGCEPTDGDNRVIPLICRQPTGQPGQVWCGNLSSIGRNCDIKAGNVCCPFDTSWICTDQASAPGTCGGAPSNRINCNDADDCGAGNDCCVDYDLPSGVLYAASCQPKGSCPLQEACRVQSDCADGGTCTPMLYDAWLSTCR